MSLSDLVLTAIALLVIYYAVPISIDFILSRNLCIYSFALVGTVLLWVIVLIYQHFNFVFDWLIQSNSLFQEAWLQNPKFIINFITNSAIFFVAIVVFFNFRLGAFNSNFNSLVNRHLFQQAAEVAEQRSRFLYRFMGIHPFLGASLGGLASFYTNIGRREDVEKLFLKALAVLKKSYFFNAQSKHSLELRANFYLKLSEFYLFEEDIVKAEAYCQEVLALRGNKKVSDIFLSQALLLKALIHGLNGNYQTFVAESTRARQSFQIWVENKKGFQNDWINKTIAIKVLKEVFFPVILIGIPILAIFFSFLRTQEYIIFWVAFVITWIIFDPLLDRMIKPNEEKLEAITKYCSLIQQEGKFYESLGDYERAEEKYQEAFSRLSTFYENMSAINKNDYYLTKELVRAKSRLNLASLQVTQGSLELTSKNKRQSYYENAVLNYDEALKIYQSINNYDNNLVNIIAQGHRNDLIVCLLERSLVNAKSVGIELVENELFEGFANVKKLLVYPKHYKQYAEALIELGNLYYWSKNYPQAEEQYSKAEQFLLQYSGNSYENTLVKTKLDYAKAFLYVATERLREALESLRQSNETANLLLLQRLSVASEKHRMNAFQSSQIYFNSYATLVSKFFNSRLEIGALFDLVLRRKAIGAEVLATQRDILLEDRYPPQKLKELKLKLEKLTENRRKIAHKTLEGIAFSDVAEFEKLNRERETLEEELAREISELNLEQKLKIVDRQMVSQSLPCDSVLIEIVLVNFVHFNTEAYQNQSEPSDLAHYLAFVLLAGQPENFCLVDLGSAKTIDRLLAKFRSKITGDFHDTSLSQSGDRHLLPLNFGKFSKLSAQDSHLGNVGVALRTKIFDPLVSAIGKRKKLFISPDGNLTQIPFEILPTDDDRQLIDIYSISYLSTGRDVLRFDLTSDRRETTGIVIADPDFDYSHDSTSLSLPNSREFQTKQSRNLNLGEFNFNRLPGTNQEGETIADLLNMQKWLGKQASKKNIFEAVRSPLILHIATHGFFLPNQKLDVSQEYLLNTTSQLLSSRLENPLLRSCLALAGANWKSKKFIPHSDTGNGILTAEEVSTLELSATELVVLSACETGRGETLAGEGVFGLRRAFVLAGAKTLIMSLWKVPDQQTKELMVDFYNRLISGESRPEALRNAQLEIRKNYPHPYFWGAFVCQGYPGAIFDQLPQRVYALLYNVGTDNEGIYTISSDNTETILFFENSVDATNFAQQLGENNFPVPSVEEIEVDEIVLFCQEEGYDYEFVPEGINRTVPVKNAELENQ